MGIDNKFLVLSKSEKQLQQLKEFIDKVRAYPKDIECGHNLFLLDGMEVKWYRHTFWGLEGNFRNTDHMDLSYQLEKESQQELIKDTILIMNYQYTDFAAVYEFFKERKESCRELFDVYDMELYKDATKYLGTASLALYEIMNYFAIAP